MKYKKKYRSQFGGLYVGFTFIRIDAKSVCAHVLIHFLPVVQGFDRWDLDLDLQLDVQSKAPKEQHQKHKHHFVA